LDISSKKYNPISDIYGDYDRNYKKNNFIGNYFFDNTKKLFNLASDFSSLDLYSKVGDGNTVGYSSSTFSDFDLDRFYSIYGGKFSNNINFSDNFYKRFNSYSDNTELSNDILFSTKKNHNFFLKIYLILKWIFLKKKIMNLFIKVLYTIHKVITVGLIKII
jgi:hypothetical protein